MKPYGIHSKRSGVSKFECCDARNGCYKSRQRRPTTRPIERVWKKRARRNGKASTKETE